MKRTNKLVYVLIFLPLLTGFMHSSYNGNLPDESGKRLFRSILRPVIVNSRDSVYEGYYSVFENRKTLSGRKISLFICVIPSLASNSKSPVFYFAGGPGGSAMRMKNFFLSQTPYRSNRDIVLIDIRGTGQSNPLHCEMVQTKKTAQECMDEMFPLSEVKECFGKLSQSSDLSQYTTEYAVDDVEEIRKWLGYEAINLMGQSYGTRICQSYLRQYPLYVRSAVMIGPAAFSMGVPAHHAYDGQKAWELLLSDCRKDSSCNNRYPQLKSEFQNLMERLSHKPDVYLFENKFSKLKETVAIKKGPLADLIRSIMYTVRGQRQVPYLIHEAFNGNYQPLIEIAIARNSDPNSIASGFYLCITCNEDIPVINKQQAAILSSSTFMGNYRLEQQLAACEVWNSYPISKDFFKPVVSSVPALVISGYHDPVTPSRWGDSVIQRMNHAQHLIIPQMAHGTAGLSNETLFHNKLNEFFKQPEKKLNDDFVGEMKEPVFK